MSAPPTVGEILERVGRGAPVEADDLGAVARHWAVGSADEAQLAALLMVVARERLDLDPRPLVEALLASGERLELASLGPVVDLCPSGAVGDATAIVAAPLAASLGVRVCATADRGVGRAFGLLDKLEAVPGMDLAPSLGAFVRRARDAGISVGARHARLVPAEARLTDLLARTGALASRLLTTAALAARIVAGGAPWCVLWTAGGAGADLPDTSAAEAVASAVAAAAAPWGRAVLPVVVDASAPIGRMVGSALEVRGAAEVLAGAGAADLRALAIRGAALAAEAAGVVEAGEGERAAARALDDGRALAAAERWVESHGGSPEVWTDPAFGGDAPLVLPVLAPTDGVLRTVDPRAVGEAARWVGAGRMHPSQAIDPRAGVRLVAGVGEEVVAGEPIAFVHAGDRGLGERAVGLVAGAALVGPAAARPEGV